MSIAELTMEKCDAASCGPRMSEVALAEAGGKNGVYLASGSKAGQTESDKKDGIDEESSSQVVWITLGGK